MQILSLTLLTHGTCVDEFRYDDVGGQELQIHDYGTRSTGTPASKDLGLDMSIGYLMQRYVPTYAYVNALLCIC